MFNNGIQKQRIRQKQKPDETEDDALNRGKPPGKQPEQYNDYTGQKEREYEKNEGHIDRDE